MCQSRVAAALISLLAFSCSIEHACAARLNEQQTVQAGMGERPMSDGEESTGNPPLCDEEIVAKECKVMDRSKHPDTVSIAELSWVTFVSQSSLATWLQSLGFESAGKDDSLQIPCLDLCHAIVESIPEDSRPPSSDMACRTGQPGENGEPDEPAIVCDVDVSPKALSDLAFDENHEEFEEGHSADDGSESSTGDVADFDMPLFELSAHDLTVRISNRFRIYPKLAVEVAEDVGDVEMTDEVYVEPPANESSLAESGESGSFCSRALCRTVKDCKTYQFSCSGCKACGGSSSSSSSRRRTTGAPFDSRRRSFTTRAPFDSRRRTSWTWTTTLPWTTRRTITTTTTTVVSTVPTWLSDVEKVSVQAQAYVAHALQVAPTSKTLLKKWFGRDDEVTVRKAMYVLNSLSGMLGNVAYAKGPKCGPNTYAYVYPRGSYSKNSKGEFVFYLCSVYFRSDLGEKIETLTHEGSHHAVAYTDDVWADNTHERKAYGRYTCKRLAQQYPDRAIKNADSHCYFINDLNAN